MTLSTISSIVTSSLHEIIAATGSYTTHHSVSSNRPVLTRPPLHEFCDRLAISVSEILSSTYKLLLHRSDSARSESFQPVLVRH